MTHRSKSLPLLLLFTLLPLGAGCLFGTPTQPPQPEPLPTYKPYYDADPVKAMDNLVHNFTTAWELRDLPEYRDSILYSSTQEATDGALYAPFTFYYDRSEDPDLPELELFDREVTRATNIFSGLPGQDGDGNVVPGIKSISLELSANGLWANPTDPDQQDGDPYPDGTKWRSYETNMLITLKGTYGANTDAWLVQDRLIFHVLPVRVVDPLAPNGYHTVYRLWKWRDIIN
jgi:hypothetical protein